MILDLAAYAGGRRLSQPAAIGELEGFTAPDDAFVWIGLRMPDADEVRSVTTALGWHEFPIQDVLAVHKRPVLTIDPTMLKLVLRTARYDDEREDVALGELSVVVTDRALLTIRYGRASPLGDVRHDLEADPDHLALGPYAVLAAIIARVVDNYAPTLDGFEHDVVETEKDVFSNGRQRPIMRIYHLKRQVRDLLMAIEALSDPLARLIRSCGHRIPPTVLPDFHETAEQLERAISRTRSLSELLDAALGATLAQISVEQNSDMRRISAWVAIAAGPTMIAGIYGMNFDYFPELRWRFGYPLVLIVMASLMLGLFRVFRRSGWL